MLKICQQIYLTDVIVVFVSVVLLVILMYVVRLVFIVVITNDEIERLILERDEQIVKETSFPGMTIAGAEAKKQYLNEKYEKLIGPLIRKKQYIFDILPFIPKK